MKPPITSDAVPRARHPTPDPRVSVVIPSWNGVRLLPTVLTSVAAQIDVRCETIVVDNGSCDGTAEYLAREWPQVRVRRLTANAGFAAGVNAGIEEARGEYVALVNNDIELDPEWAAALVAELDADPGVAAVAGKLLSYADRGLLEECGTEFAWNGTVSHRGNWQRDTGQFEAPADVFSVCAAAALYRGAAFAAIGALDARLFAYNEDLDWAFRAHRAGFRLRYVARARAFHMGSATTTAQSVPKLRLSTRNMLALIVKCYPASELRRHLWAVASRQLYVAGSAARRGWLPAYLRAVAGVLAMLPHLLAERRRIDRIGNLTGIPFPELPVHHR